MKLSRRINRLLKIDCLDDWTRSYCVSLLEQVTKGRKLSHRQVEILKQKETEYSEERLVEEKSWFSSWDEEKAEIFRVCAMYYRTTGYYRDLAGKVDFNGVIEEDFTPSKRQFNKMCNNKYALKVRKAWFDDPKYPVGTVVAVRDTAPSYCTDGTGPIRSRTVERGVITHFVIAANADYPKSSCNGAKIYKILAAGSSIPFNIEERHIKKMRKASRR